MSITAVVLAGLAGWTASGGAGLLARLDHERARPRRHLVVLVGCAVLVGSCVVVGSGEGAPGVAVPVLTAIVLALGRRQLRRRAGLRAADQRRDVLSELLAALVAELRAGADPRPAVLAAAEGLAGLESVVTAAAGASGDVAAALRVLALESGGSSAGELAAVWRVGEVTGCGLAVPVARVLLGHRTEDRLRREVAAQLAGPIASAHLLAALPLIGIGLGTALGADPMGFLLGAPSGRIVLAAGAALVAAGVVWTRRITAAAIATTAGWDTGARGAG